MIQRVTYPHCDHPFAAKVSPRSVHREIEGKFRFSDLCNAAGNVGVLAVKIDGNIEPADLIECCLSDDKISTLKH